LAACTAVLGFRAQGPGVQAASFRKGDTVLWDLVFDNKCTPVRVLKGLGVDSPLFQELR
jgi:hypothetical protein